MPRVQIIPFREPWWRSALRWVLRQRYQTIEWTEDEDPAWIPASAGYLYGVTMSTMSETRERPGP